MNLFVWSLVVGCITVVVATRNRKQKQKLQVTHHHLTPQLHMTVSSNVPNFEIFCHYVARQIGFTDANEVPHLCDLASEYLMRKSEGCEQNIYEYIADEPNGDSLYEKLIEEFERCILSYYAYYWNHASFTANQVLTVESRQRQKPKEFLLAAERKKRFEQITKKLQRKRVFCTLAKEMQSIHRDSIEHTDRVAPDAYHNRNPILLLMGGGIGAGKSTVLEDIILKESMWTELKPVLVEADALKQTEAVQETLESSGLLDDMLQIAEQVHKSSTDDASKQLVAALNEGRDVIMDGTLAWEAYVRQTIAMARNIHKCKYRMGKGYISGAGGEPLYETYWEPIDEEQEEPYDGAREQYKNRLPYRIELVGVVCDPYLAVIRGIRRAFLTKGRAVRVSSQLRSHKRFASAFPTYCELVDNARLFSNNYPGYRPKLIAWKNRELNLEDREEMKLLTTIRSLNPDAESIHDLYDKHFSPLSESGSIWTDIVMLTARRDSQKELWESIVEIEKKLAKEQ